LLSHTATLLTTVSLVSAIIFLFLLTQMLLSYSVIILL
jgi:hypothetical protein